MIILQIVYILSTRITINMKWVFVREVMFFNLKPFIQKVKHLDMC